MFRSLKFIYVCVVFLGLISLLPVLSFAEGCDEMIAEAEAISGIVPKLNDDGSIHSLSMYGEASFLTPKRSLISSARTQAEMKAKREFSNFLQENLKAGTMSSYLMETIKITNANGETTGRAIEINSVVDQMSSNTQAVLSGIVKLDECVDTNQNYILVRMGWKPLMSQVAVRAAQDMQSTNNDKRETTSDSGTSQNEKGGSNIKVVTVVVEGRGGNINDAIKIGLRQAISQVFGEHLESEVEIEQATHTLEVSGDLSLGVAVEVSSQIDKSKSKTRGTIKSYEIVSKEETATAIVVFLKVNLAKYETGIDRSKKTLIVLQPKTDQGEELVDFARRLQSILESNLSTSGAYNMLDREHLEDTMKELSFISSSNASIEEMARLGNHAGADLIVVTEILSFSTDESSRVVGDREIKRGSLNAQVSLKLIDPATTKIFVSDTLSFNNQRVQNASLNDYSIVVADRISQRILRASGSKMSQSESDDSLRQQASKEANEKFKALEEKHESNW